MDDNNILLSPQERFTILKKYEVGFQQSPERVIQHALRTVPDVSQMPEAIQKVLAQVYGIIPENPSEDILDRAMRWAFAHISPHKNMIHPDLLENQWERVIRHYLGRHEWQKDIGIYAEITLLENLLLHAITRLKSDMEYDIHMADCLGDSDFMTDLILIQKFRGKILQLGIQLTTHRGSPKKKQKFFPKRDLHDRGLHPSPKKRLVGSFLRKNTWIIQVQHFRPCPVMQEAWLKGILGGNPSEMLQTGMLHRAEMSRRRENMKHKMKAPSKEIGRQFFELLQFFHDGIMEHTIVPSLRYSHHQYWKVNERWERISGRVFEQEGIPIFEARLTEVGHEPSPETYRMPRGIQPVIFSIPIPQRFISEYYKFASE
jgi:hypothetical protein